MFDFIIGIVTNKKFYLPIIYVAVGIVVYFIVAGFIKKVSRFGIISKDSGAAKRKVTIIVLINNIIKYIIAIIVILSVLSLYGINTTSILASLGVVGVVVGLAFQDIVKDFLAGIFIIFDNEYAVGDIVEINGFKGEVISLGLKTTKIKSVEGNVKILSNSSFQEVINYNLDKDNLFIKLPISYNEDVDRVEKVLSDLKDEILKIKDVKNVKLLGIDSFNESSMSYMISILCEATTQYVVKRKVLGIIKKEFDKNKIIIPYSQIDIHLDK